MNTEDHKAIRAIIERQFGSLNWSPGTSANWSAFLGDFLPGASLYPAARPAKSQKPEEFVERMRELATTKLHSFKEDALGREISVFGNVAVAVCQITENETQVTQGIEMMLLVKTDGRWQVVSQAWDTEGESKQIPADLLDPH
jgi:Putative lumazine-binding